MNFKLVSFLHILSVRTIQ